MLSNFNKNISLDFYLHISILLIWIIAIFTITQEVLNLYNMDTNVINTGVQIGLLVVAMLGLRQFQLSRKQSAIEQLKEFADLLKQWDDLAQELIKKGYVNTPFEMKEYTLKEFLSLSRDQQKTIKDSYVFWGNKDNFHLTSEIKHIMNRMEVISTVFSKGVASISIIETIIPTAFCLFVESHAILYIQERHGASMLYENTIDLYKSLKVIYGSQDERKRRFDQDLEGTQTT